MLELSEAQKQDFYRDGYVVLPGAVEPGLIEVALRAINNSLGWRGIHPDQLPIYNSQSFCPELTTQPVILDLAEVSGLKALLQTTVGGPVGFLGDAGQIALRFPFPTGATSEHIKFNGPHLDGMPAPNNGVPEGKVLNFTGLLGIFLSDTPQANMGNFTVWPGSHHLYEAYLRQYGPESLLDGMPEIELPTSVQITAKAGDAILAHYQLGHTVAPNLSSQIRYAIYFRFARQGHAQISQECFTDIWREWDNILQI